MTRYKMAGNVGFIKEWLTNPKNSKWLEKTASSEAHWKIFHRFIDLSNMGRCALGSQLKGKKHMEASSNTGTVK